MVRSTVHAGVTVSTQPPFVLHRHLTIHTVYSLLHLITTKEKRLYTIHCPIISHHLIVPSLLTQIFSHVSIHPRTHQFTTPHTHKLWYKHN
ncbi:hypothetical protein EX30DRAFT_202093 [Ascodesmis nigricans]|uniref:Uncharacterized protein n=1 Tax=Ascodesmis nigricans TaxID=341454 RepID=A0A4S2MK57_9PEZI|nr:hypothetical protein EX30DRAFT_202093 [Ascodesmis nigricans]